VQPRGRLDKLNDLLLQRGINVIVKKWWSELSEEFDVKDADTSSQEERLNSPG